MYSSNDWDGFWVVGAVLFVLIFGAGFAIGFYVGGVRGAQQQLDAQCESIGAIAVDGECVRVEVVR